MKELNSAPVSDVAEPVAPDVDGDESDADQTSASDADGEGSEAQEAGEQEEDGSDGEDNQLENGDNNEGCDASNRTPTRKQKKQKKTCQSPRTPSDGQTSGPATPVALGIPVSTPRTAASAVVTTPQPVEVEPITKLPTGKSMIDKLFVDTFVLTRLARYAGRI